MKKRSMLAVAVIGLFALAQGVFAEPKRGLGVGVIVGEPTGISIKKWISDERAIDAALAWSFSENDSFQFHADYLIHNFGLLNIEPADHRLPVYYGIGARVKLRDSNNDRGRNNDDTLIGIRVPFGISYIFKDEPFDIFAEIVPVLDVVPDTDFDINAAIGVRFYFR